MRVYPVPSSVLLPLRRQYLTSFVVNGTVAIDAGSLAFGLSRPGQRKIRHIFISHTHLDHLASLPMFLDNAMDGSGTVVNIYATPSTLECLRTDLFNDRLWPDFVLISERGTPFLQMHELTPRVPVEVDGLRVTPILVDHVVECLGFVVEEPGAAVLFSSDTGPTEEIWQVGRGLPDLKAAFMEVTFPDDMVWLAEKSKHLTPALAAREREKLPPGVQVLGVHLHARHRPKVVRELKAAQIPGFEVVRFGKMYHF